MLTAVTIKYKLFNKIGPQTADIAVLKGVNNGLSAILPILQHQYLGRLMSKFVLHKISTSLQPLELTKRTVIWAILREISRT